MSATLVSPSSLFMMQKPALKSTTRLAEVLLEWPGTLLLEWGFRACERCGPIDQDVHSNVWNSTRLYFPALIWAVSSGLSQQSRIICKYLSRCLWDVGGKNGMELMEPRTLPSASAFELCASPVLLLSSECFGSWNTCSSAMFSPSLFMFRTCSLNGAISLVFIVSNWPGAWAWQGNLVL